MDFNPPTADCSLCPRLADFRRDNWINYHDFFNAPVPSFGGFDAQLLVVGLAPGLKGANRTGRPFTGDYAGLVLYAALVKYGFAQGGYDPEKVAAKKGECQSGDGFTLVNCRITNAVRCVPQQNKPEPSEIRQCNNFLKAEIAAMPNLKVILSLGQISHKSVLMALGFKQSAYAFGHGLEHVILRPSCFKTGAGSRAAYRTLALDPAVKPQDDGKIVLLNSYHCSRYNINTGALTQAMFDKMVERARDKIKI
jgi:uracil-DNA glycosylase